MQPVKTEPEVPVSAAIDEEIYKKWKPLYRILNDFATQVIKKENSKKSETCAKNLDQLLREVFRHQLTNALYVNNIQTKVCTDGQLSFIYDHMGYACIETILRLMFRLIQNSGCKVDLIYFKEVIAIFLKHLRLNDGKPYSYIVGEMFSLLIDLNRTQNEYLKHGHDRSLLLNDIRQFRQYSVKVEQLGNAEYRLDEVPVPLTSLNVIRLYYVQLLKVLAEFVEPMQDLSSAYGEHVANLIELNLVCSTPKMDSALVSFVINRFFVFDFKNVHFQRYFQFVFSITDRYTARPDCDHKQLEALWLAFFKNLDSLNAEDKRIQLMCYLVENSINLYQCRNEHFVQFILPTVLFKVFDGQFGSQPLDERCRSIYHRLIMRVLDFYISSLAESGLQSDQWCRLIKCLLKQDFYAPLDFNDQQVFNATNCNYLFKFWDFLSQYAGDDFLFSSPNHLLKSINYANVLLPCLLYIDLKDECNFPKFFDFDTLNKIINTLLLEFSKPEPSIQEHGDALIEHIYAAVHSFVRLAKQLNDESGPKHELSVDQMAVFYRPWHEAKIKFVREHPEVMNRLSRRAFERSNKVLRICLAAISELPAIQYDNQMDFFDHILKNEFDQLKELIKPVFISYMFIANNLSPDHFKSWLTLILEKQEETKFVASVLGRLACILHKDRQMVYEAADSTSAEIEFGLTCVTCEKLCDDGPLNENLDLELINLIRQKFNSYLNLDDLENFNVVVRESSERFFNHIDIDEQLKQNVLNLFNIADPEAQRSFDLLLCNMFRPLKVQKESFFKSFSERYFGQKIVDSAIQVRTAKFENIALMCNHFPKYQLPIVIYLLKNGILYNRDFYFNTSIILRNVVFGYDRNALVDYFVKNSNRICEEMLRQILELDVEDNQVAFDWIRKLTFSFVEYQDGFLHLFVHSFQVILPFFVRYRNARSELMLKHILNNLKFNTPENLVLQYFDPLILYFARNMTVKEIEESFDYIDTLLGVNIRRLFRRKGPILYPLLYEYSDQTKSKNYLLSILSSQDGLDDEPATASKPFVDFNKDASALRAYLTEKMGGYLTNLNTQFLNMYERNPTIAFKTLLLKSLNFIIKAVHPKTISSYFEKLMAILRVAFKYQSPHDEDYEGYVYFLLSVWDTLISECEKKDLTKNLSLICKNLIDFLDKDQAGTTKVLSKLIIDNEAIMRNSLKELHFIPHGVRLMNPVHHVIQKYVFKMPETGDIKGFEKALKDLEQCLQVENPEIKYFHYKALLQVLSKNEQCLRSFYSSGNDLRVQPIISRLMHRMIADSKMDDQNLRIIIGECLGEFGAIDPGRLDLSHSAGQKSTSKFLYTSIEDSSFAILIIDKLVACFDLVNESKFQDCINYALQELLKVYKVKQSTSNEIWKSIQPRCQSICQQLFNTKFCVKEEICSPSHPVYKESREFSDWICKWSIAIVDKIENRFAKSVFASLRPLMNYNASIAEYLLPFLIMVVLIHDKREDTEKIYEEINYLVKHCLPGSSPSQQQQQSDVEMVDQENRDEAAAGRSSQPREITVLYETNSDQYHCVHALFTLFDFLTNWCKQTKNQFCLQKKLSSRHSKSSVASTSLTKTPSYKMFNVVSDFLAKISKSELSILAASCQSYDRALMYLEEYVHENKNELASNYDNLQRLYVALEEPDGVDGIIVCRKEEPSLLNSILSHEVNGELQEAISCCEKANRIYPSELNYSKIYLRCLLLLGHEYTAKIFATNLIDQRQDYLNDLQPFIVEAAWKMGEWNDLEKELTKLNSPIAKFEVGIGGLFNVIKNNHDHKAFDTVMKDLRLIETSQISVASAGSRAYTRNYPNLVRLHMLNEIEHFYKNNFVNLRSNKERIAQLTKRFTMRTKIVQTSVRLKEPLINLQRVLLNICSSNLNSGNESELAELWLSSAKLARKSNNFQSAYNFLLEIQILEQKSLARVQALTREPSAASFTKDLRAKIVIEKAKYHWQKDTLEDKEKAVKELYRGIEQLSLQMEEPNFRNLKNCLTFAKLHTLYNNYSERTLNLDSETLKNNYVAITTCYNQWEESHYNLGIYFDSLAKSVELPHEKAEFLDKVIKNLGESLKYGSKHVYESMPKLLTAWCDLGDFKVALSKSKSTSKAKKQQEEHEMAILDKYCSSASRSIKLFLSSIQPSNFYTAISQLTSRMCHPLDNISELIAEIITKLVNEYPHQTIWLILSSLLSEEKVRKDKFTRMIGKISQHFHLIQSYVTFGTIFCKICNYEGEQRTSFNLDEQFPNLKRQLDHNRVNNFQLLVPFQSFMSVQLPNANRDGEQQQSLKTNQVFIQEIDKEVVLLRSLVKPKKITIKGSDGQTYVMMCKPKDDLRKDNRTMEFNNLVNRHLRKDSETRKRNLFIKTYTVVPLRHDCGLIEWINDLQGYRDTVMGTYAREIDDWSYSSEKIAAIYPKKTWSVADSVKVFTEKLLKQFPSIYHRWFLNQFENPTAWYNARLNYVRSCAVMSIVGYIIGLGDRHGENILINVKTGHLVHVDFNCIFNKGAELDVPEVVPFRLTHNMIDAMGPTGYEGVFRKTCESTLRVMREQREALMSVLTTFVHDPLIEWNRRSRNTTSSRRNAESEAASEAVNKTALENLDRIRYRLNGLLGLDVKKDDEDRSLSRSMINKSIMLSQTNHLKIPISVNYQVQHLIEEATNVERLAVMFIGWNSFL